MKKLFVIIALVIGAFPLLHAQSTSVSPGHLGIGGEDTIVNSLPVKLIILTVRPQSEDAILNWQTASEINSDYFEVERAIRCNPCNEQSWSALGNVKASGNSNDIRAYQFVDTKLKYHNPQPQTVYYRLKQVDKDGAITYSNIIALDIKVKLNTITLYPLPINNILTAVSSNSENITELSIFDMSGKEIMKSSGGQIDVNTLAQGMYVVRVITDKQIYVQKITK
jgi:Secretion system C-terminal sorting domain